MKSNSENLIFDFDNMSLRNFFIGKSPGGKNDEVIKEKELGYAIGIKKGIVSNISIYLDGGLYGFSGFFGDFKKNFKLFKLSQSTRPDVIKEAFGEPDSEWDDGVEKNLQFVFGRYRIEFSWHVDSQVPSLTYFSVELETEGGKIGVKS